MTYTVGQYLAERLVQIGLDRHFAVAGDYNLVLLDQLLTEKKMEQVYCCNELNCGFSAEGYARARGAAAAVVTFGVGAISAMNALGGAFAENLPVILISGGPNSNDRGSGRILHHTLGTTNLDFQLNMAREVTCAAESINDAASAPAKIDHVIRTALREQKPAYLDIACNVANAECTRPGPITALLAPESDATSLNAALDRTIAWLADKKDVVVLVGSRIRAAHAQKAAEHLAGHTSWPVAIMAAAKSFFPETHPSFRGLYWGEVSDPGVQDLVEKADAVLCLGAIFNDYSTVGWTAWPKAPRALIADKDSVTVDGVTFADVTLPSFLEGLTSRLPHASVKPPQQIERRFAPAPTQPDAALTNDEMMRQIQKLVTSNTTLSAETGDSWFNAMRLGLPEGARVEVEMQWGHIGWSVPSAFGNAIGSPERRHIVMVGDGSFQLTAQEVAQMVRHNLPVIIFLINNRGYVIEIAIHDGPYNYIQNWDYAGLMEVFNGGTGHALGLHAKTGGELEAAILKAVANTGGPTLIECTLDRDDCTAALRKWGKVVAATNARAPRTA
ncbi:alpha-keto acid decarboxylase family protein [Asaia lannensis]|uniref:pyruvate decarboxylase n=1 Tax=Asaia lannensis NBRC 102526 TaxID=1307926 RepID=A0ABT1CF79_9PROT|nr:thiamine pyrophosphate-binding protein [Asaia lannensis]MCO6159513.1 thiamine pyrophosphate-binding protein [Asaia lannensis NBRC 102526]